MAWLGIYQNAEVNIFFLSIAFFLSNFSVYLFSSVSKTATGASDKTLCLSLENRNRGDFKFKKMSNLKNNQPVTPGAAIFVCVVFFIIFLVFKCSCSETDQEIANRTEQNSEFTAYYNSQQCVKELLKSPSTAEFPSGSNQFVTKIDEDTYLINSYVDSQNSFGAMLRTNYVCQVTLNSDDTYTCDSVELLEQ